MGGVHGIPSTQAHRMGVKSSHFRNSRVTQQVIEFHFQFDYSPINRQVSLVMPKNYHLKNGLIAIYPFHP